MQTTTTLPPTTTITTTIPPEVMQDEDPLSIDSLMSMDQPYQDIPNTINSGKYNCFS